MRLVCNAIPFTPAPILQRVVSYYYNMMEEVMSSGVARQLRCMVSNGAAICITDSVSTSTLTKSQRKKTAASVR